MSQTVLSTLRNVHTKSPEFRKAGDQASLCLATQLFAERKTQTQPVQTPLTLTSGKSFEGTTILLPILRAGLCMLSPFLQMFSDARVGFIGLERNEETAQAKQYYFKIPNVEKEDEVIVLDPMLATGGSMMRTIELLIEQGVQEEQILVAAIIASTQGREAIQARFPKVRLFILQEDPELNTDHYIVPGLGDFGDRYFGTGSESGMSQ